MLEGALRGRNELIQDSIYRDTGIRRDRKQVSSHLQVLKEKLKGLPAGKCRRSVQSFPTASLSVRCECLVQVVHTYVDHVSEFGTHNPSKVLLEARCVALLLRFVVLNGRVALGAARTRLTARQSLFTWPHQATGSATAGARPLTQTIRLTCVTANLHSARVLLPNMSTMRPHRTFDSSSRRTQTSP
jgi:hypothetical protein